jgi:hypothetical protein
MNDYVRKRWLPLIGIMLLAAIGVSPVMADNSIGNAVQVRSIASESVGAYLRVKVELTNTSAQPITAYTLRATVTPEGGRPVQSEITRDMVWVLALARSGQPVPSGSGFGPGQITQSTVDVPISAEAAYPGDPAPVLKTTAEVTMVAFADRTALGSAKAMASLMYSRVDGAGEAKEMVAVLGGLQGAGDAHAAMRELVLAAQKNVTAAAPGNSGHMLAERRLAALRTFAMPVAEHPEALAPAAKLWQARYEILNEHSALRPVETGVVREEEEK